jgi:hypothetical protein
MQTFLVDTGSFEVTARQLDNKRLHKQTLEAWQTLLTLTCLDPEGNDRQQKGWVNHPVTRMWRGSEALLVSYISATYFEWRSRGYKSTLLPKTFATFDRALELGRVSSELTLPSWMQDGDYFSRLVSTHRRALLVKNYEWYSQFDYLEDPGSSPGSYEYLWPHQDGFMAA